MAGKYLRGALIQITETFGAPVPNVIIFQYNPETLTHAWSPLERDLYGGQGTNPLAVRGLPGESFSFTLAMDASDRIGEGDPVAITSGIYSRISALEMLLFPIPSPDDPAASLTAGAGDAGSALAGALDSSEDQTVPAGVLPVVLFVWGPARILPVRVQSLSINETLYDALLNPTHAEATITLQVLTKQDLANAAPGPLVDLGIGAYNYTHGARQVFALANLANAVESPIGMVPFL